MPYQKPLTEYDPDVQVTDASMLKRLGESALLGNWFLFLKPDWLERSGLHQLLSQSGVTEKPRTSAILFRGKEELVVPGATIAAKKLPEPDLVSITCDKALYRANRDTVRLLIASPRRTNQQVRLKLRLSGNPYADYPVVLDEFGLNLWSMQGLPEGEYEASLAETEADVCRFEVAEYRLAPLNADLQEQRLGGDVLRYVLSVTAFGQPYSGPVEIELQERGQRVGKRERLTCNRDGQCRGAVKLTGQGPYTLNIFADERSATVALKGSEQERRETLTISELGEGREMSLLPLPQSNMCRGMYIARGAANNEPLMVRRVIGKEVEITARTNVEQLRVVVLGPAQHSYVQHLYSHVKAEQNIHVSIPSPYGIVLLGAFIAGSAWEGWCAVLHPSEIHLQCEAPKDAKPGSRVTITLKTGLPERVVPVQLIVKDQRLIAPGDPQVEFAAQIKKNISQWREESGTGKVKRQLDSMQPAYPPFPPFGPMFRTMAAPAPTGALPPPPMPFAAVPAGPAPQAAPVRQRVAPLASGMQSVIDRPAATQTVAAPTATLTKIRMQFPEIVYNSIVRVQGEAQVEVTLGDSMTRYSIEAFALSPETLDWQRVETSLEATQPVYGELTVSPFVFPNDPVMGRLDVGAASGGAIVEVRHDNEILPLFHEDGSAVTPGLPIPSGSVLRFPVRPGMITSTVRDARKGGSDVSERYVSEPGKLCHIMRRLRLLTPGDEVTLNEQNLLSIQPMPGLEQPFQFFVEGAAKYPFGCIEQTSTKVVSMYTGYITNMENAEVARDYEAAILIWYKRLKSMYLPQDGFCFYPPEEGGARKRDTYYAPKAVKRLLNLPDAAHSGIQQPALRELLDDIRAMVTDAASYYNITYPPQLVQNCHDAYQVLISNASSSEKERAAAFVRSQLTEQDGQSYVKVDVTQTASGTWRDIVTTREETAYAAAALLATKEPGDLPKAIAATNYLTSQFNEEGRLYSTVDTAACLALLIGLRDAGIVATGNNGRVMLNGQEISLLESLRYEGKIETLRCVEGVIAAQVTSEVIEDWSAFKSDIPVEVRLERKGRVQQSFKVGDALDLVISVPQYEPGLLAHVCLPDALARIVGGGQVKRFSLDFCEKNTLRIPLAAVGSTKLPQKDAETEKSLLNWLGGGRKHSSDPDVQHWAIIVRNMFKEEQAGNPGLLEVKVE